MKELAENYKRMIELRAKQQEQPSEEVLSSEVQTVYQEFYQKLKEKHLTEEEKADLRQRYPELYDMVRSLEREMAACQEKLRFCRKKEEVLEIRENYETELLKGGLLINNQAFPLIKKLEYTMFKDTKLSFIENIIDQFIESDAYKKLPGDAAEEEEADTMTGEDEETRLQRARHARARATYEGVKDFLEERAESGIVPQASFDVKG